MEQKTSEEIAKKYNILTNWTPIDERYIWRTQIKWVKVEDVIALIDGGFGLNANQLRQHIKTSLTNGR